MTAVHCVVSKTSLCDFSLPSTPFLVTDQRRRGATPSIGLACLYVSRGSSCGDSDQSMDLRVAPVAQKPSSGRATGTAHMEILLGNIRIGSNEKRDAETACGSEIQSYSSSASSTRSPGQRISLGVIIANAASPISASRVSSSAGRVGDDGRVNSDNAFGVKSCTRSGRLRFFRRNRALNNATAQSVCQ